MDLVKATPYARKIAAEYHIDLRDIKTDSPGGAIRARDVFRARESRRKRQKVQVTPLAMRMAEKLGVDPKTVSGTGIGGKISKADIIKASDKPSAVLAPGELMEPMSAMRRAIAEEMTAAAAVPTVTVTTKVDVTELTEARLRHNSVDGNVKYSVNDLILMAVVRALGKNRRFLSSFAGDGIIYKSDINLGVAVSLPEGLVVPVIRDADTLTMDELAAKARELIDRARNHRISEEDLAGSTFTVTNMGMYGVEAFTPLLHLPNSAILGVCSIYDGCTVVDGKASVRKMMHICLTIDHRVLDGADAAKFNLAVRECLENPGSLITG